MATKRRTDIPLAPVQQASAMAGAPSAPSGPVVGRLLAGSQPGAPIVDFSGNRAGPLRARTTLMLDEVTLDHAIRTGQAAVLIFEQGDHRLPIVTGLVQSDRSPSPFQELLVSPRAAAPSGGPQRQRVEARLDGERVVLEGKKEVVLKCGEASITLRSDGKMVLRGAYIETYAKGVNRIKGGSVKIN